MSEASIYELKRRKAKQKLDQGAITPDEYMAEVMRLNAEEQAEIRALQNAIQRTRLNR